MTKPWLGLYLVLAGLYLALVSSIQFPLTTCLKPLPILLLAIYVAINCKQPPLRKYLLLALIFSMGGDIALSVPMAMQLETGLGLFLLAHVFYIIIFSRSLKFDLTKSIVCLAIIISSAMMFSFIHGYLGELLIPVVVYMLVINVMAISAIGGTKHHWVSAAGAVVFMVSDSLIALDEFVFTDINFTLAIMTSYYLAQLLIVTGILYSDWSPKHS